MGARANGSASAGLMAGLGAFKAAVAAPMGCNGYLEGASKSTKFMGGNLNANYSYYCA